MFYFSATMAKLTLNHNSLMLQDQTQRWTCENTGLEIRKYWPTKHLSTTEKTEKPKVSYVRIGEKKVLLYLVILTHYREIRI